MIVLGLLTDRPWTFASFCEPEPDLATALIEFLVVLLKRRP
jgi:hypothetical protein